MSSPATMTPGAVSTRGAVRRRQRAWVAVVLGVASVVAGWGNLQAWTDLPSVNAARNPVALVLLIAGSVALPLLGVAALRLRRSTPAAAPVLLLAAAGAVLLWLAYAAAAGGYVRARVGCAVGTWAAGVAVICWRARPAPARPGRVTVLLASSALSLLVGELLLRAAAAVWPGPLLLPVSADAERRLRAYAFAPGQRHFDLACNTLGFFDGEFAAPLPARGRTVAVIGDSFSASFVPHERHYTTIAEGALGDTAVWNVGWAALGPTEYRALLERHVLPLQPDVIVVGVFLGNDLAETRPLAGSDRWLASWFDRGNVLLLEVPRRLWRAARGAGVADSGARATYGDLAAARAWLDDPGAEPGTFASDEFLRIEVERARDACTPTAGQWDAFTAELQALQASAGALPFGFLLIPDEFMVEDGLWRQVVAATGTELPRHALRERLVAWCRERRIPCRDLWPALTAVPPLRGGDRHLYLRRDTHWNARGNAVAGAELAAFIRELQATR